MYAFKYDIIYDTISYHHDMTYDDSLGVCESLGLPIDGLVASLGRRV